MANSFTIEIDAVALRAALEGDSLKAVMKTFIKAASKISADHICQDAKARLLRQLSGTSTGATVAGIRVMSDRTGWGWVVDAGNLTTPQLDFWLDYGFKNFARRKPFFWDAAQVEQAAHLERVRAAIQAALSEYGLAGDQAA